MAAMKPAFKQALADDIQAGMSRGTLQELIFEDGLAWEEQEAPNSEVLRASLRRRRQHIC